MGDEIPHSGLEKLDYILMASYMIVLLGLGAFISLTKRAGRDTEGYFLAGRKMPGWLNGISYAATCMNTDVAPAYCGMTVITGLFVCWWYISRFSLALMIGAVLFAVFWRRLNLSTSPEFYEIRFSGALAMMIRAWVAIRSVFIAVVAWTGAGLLGMHKVAQPLLGWDIWTTFAVVIPIILVYVLLSGYVGVVLSDFFQTLVIITSSIVLMYLVMKEFGSDGGVLHGPVGLKTALLNQFGSRVISWHPPKSHELLGVMGVIAWTIGTAVGYGGDAAPMAGAMEGQRILSCKNPREASKMYIWTEITLFFMLAVLTLPALGAMVKWPGLNDGSINKELAYGMLLGSYLPVGLLGLAVCGILASIMSTVSSNMNFGAQVFVNDVYKRILIKQASEKHYLTIGRIVAAMIVFLAMIVATTAENVIDIAVFMLGLSSAELTANWAQWWWWRFNSKARLAASFGGPVIFLLNKFVVFRYLIDAGQDTTYLVVLFSIATTCVVWIVVALVTEPEPEAKLVEFYRQAQPMGWWGKIAHDVDGRYSAGHNQIFVGLLVAALGAIMISAATIGFNSLYIARWQVAAIAGFVAIMAGVVFISLYGKIIDK